MTETPPETVVALHAIGKTFGRQTVLAGITLAFKAGRVHALCGLNGSGKSTLIKILTGVIAPDAGGAIAIGDELVAALTPSAAREAGIDAIFQDLALFPNLSVADNIAFGEAATHPAGLRRAGGNRELAARLIGRLGVTLDVDAAVETLSIAERQIVAIARSLVRQPRLLILDEPTASLPAREVARLLAIVRELAAAGVAILFVSHRHEEVTAIADEVIVLRDGRLVRRQAAATLTRDGLALDMAGRSIVAGTPPPARPDGPILVETCKLARKGEYEAVDLTVHAGEVVGITGLLGARRTELALSLFGMTRPDSGSISVGGIERQFRSNRGAIDAGIAYVSEDRAGLGLVLEASIADNIAMASRRRLVTRAGLIDRAATARIVADLIRDLEIKAPDPAAPISTLSGGNQQRVAIAKWLATHPSVLILDSPTVGVDVTAREAIYRLIRQLAANGSGIILISDEFDEVLANTTVLHVMAGGRLSPPLDPRSLTETQLAEIVHG